MWPNPSEHWRAGASQPSCSNKPNATAISPFRYITWPTSVSIHDKTLNGGKIHCYNDIDLHEIAKTLISPSPSNSGPAEA